MSPRTTLATNFIIDYISTNADENGEVHARACINAALIQGIPEHTITKARWISRARIGRRKATRRYGDIGNGWIWYIIPPSALLEDSSSAFTPVESSKSAA